VDSTFEVRPVPLGPSALDFVREQVALGAGEGFDGPLAARLERLSLDEPFAFLTADTKLGSSSEWDSLDQPIGNQHLAKGIRRWLGESPGRLLVLEEPLGLRYDPATHREPRERTLFFKERKYYIASSRTDQPDTLDSLDRVSGYPGIGVLTAPGINIEACLGRREFSRGELDRLAKRALAVLVRAWDDEAFMIAPVKCRLDPEALEPD
jgi:hypothetical protein